MYFLFICLILNSVILIKLCICPANVNVLNINPICLLLIEEGCTPTTQVACAIYRHSKGWSVRLPSLLIRVEYESLLEKSFHPWQRNALPDSLDHQCHLRYFQFTNKTLLLAVPFEDPPVQLWKAIDHSMPQDTEQNCKCNNKPKDAGRLFSWENCQFVEH
jgi:hypothetical protein